MKARMEALPTRFITTVGAMWDPTPRFFSMPFMFSPAKSRSLWKLDPKNWRRLLREARQLCDTLPEDAIGRKIILLDNWNEWDEGHYLLPSVEFGFRYLQAIREEFTLRDNLPDYRTPHDQGFTGYNTSWRTPDFAEFCKKRLEGEDSQ